MNATTLIVAILVVGFLAGPAAGQGFWAAILDPFASVAPASSNSAVGPSAAEPPVDTLGLEQLETTTQAPDA